MKQVAVMLCGPHENGSVCNRRIDEAIYIASSKDIPLIIAGDGNYGNDIAHFTDRANLDGVHKTIGLYSERASTFSDSMMVADVLSKYDEFVDVNTIYLVTDWWHMPRASLFFTSAMQLKKPGFVFDLKLVNVSTPRPPEWVIEAEHNGVKDFLRGEYGSNGCAVIFGKPSNDLSVEFAYT